MNATESKRATAFALRILADRCGQDTEALWANMPALVRWVGEVESESGDDELLKVMRRVERMFAAARN